MKSFDHSDWKQNKGENIFIANNVENRTWILKVGWF